MSPAAAFSRVRVFLALAVLLNFILWCGSNTLYARWAGVPPVPTKTGALLMTLGDPEFSYRFGAITLQQLGDGGGRVTPLKDYDYKSLGKWFWLLNDLDPASDHVPMIAAYYFGGTQVPSDVAVVVDYLGAVGNSPVGDKWRWLAQAVYLARHKMNDLPRALDLAYELARIKPLAGPLPSWAQQMPAFVLRAKGDKDSARQIMEQMLATEDRLDPAEVNFMRGYLVGDLGTDPKEVDAIIALRGKRVLEKP